MNFDLSEDQRMLADTVREFTAKSSPVGRFRKLRDTEGTGWDSSVWRQMGELGWLSIPFPEAIGGFGGTFVDVALVLEHFGRALVPEPYLASVVAAGSALVSAGSPEQQGRFLASMIEGRSSLALAWAERPSRYGFAEPGTRAERSADGYVLRGEKVWVLNGHAADHVVVSAMAPDGVALFVVDRDTDGMTVDPVRTMDGHRAAMVHLEGVRVGTDRRLGEEGDGTSSLARAFDCGAAGAVAEGLGVCQTALDMSVEYLQTREQFGVKIGVFQALQHRAVDMFVENELLRSISMEASVMADTADVEARAGAISAAKHQLASGGLFIVQQAIQLHGGIGVTDEHDVGLYFKRAHVLSMMFGDRAHHLARYAALPDFAA